MPLHFNSITNDCNNTQRLAYLLQKGIEKYAQYCRCYDTYMQTAEAKTKIASFEKHFPGVEITDIKKLDFMLWQER